MTVTNTTRRVQYTGNGATSVYAFSFKVFAAADISVTELVISTGVETLYVLDSNYTVSLNADQEASPGGTITLTAGNLPSTKKITIIGDLDYTQPTDITNQGAFNANVVENVFDRAAMLIQQLLEMINRALVANVSGTEVDASGARLTNLADGVDNQDAATVAQLNEAVLGSLVTPLAIVDGGTGASTAAGARTNLGLGTAAVANTGDFEAAGAVSTHVGLADPHTQYVLESALTESVEDIVGALIVDSTTLDVTYTDNGAGAGTESIEIKTVYNPVGAHDVWVPAAAMTPRTSNGCSYLTTVESATNKVMVDVLDFDQTTDEFAQFSFKMPKSWNESTITAQFVWTASGTGDVVWTLGGLALADDDAIDTAFGTEQSVTDAVTAIGDVMISAATGAITIGGSPAEGDLVIFQVSRDANNGSDTLAADARLIGVKLTITTNAATDA